MNTHYLFGLPFATIKVNSFEVDAIVDTGFNGALMLPKQLIAKLKLPRMGYAEYTLADGTLSQAAIFAGQVMWFNATKKVSVISCESDLALVGMELLFDAKFTLCPAKGVLTIEPI